MSKCKAWRVGTHKGSTNVFEGKGNEIRLVAECGTHEQAHLIAAAPDLLEALNLLVADIDTQGFNVDPAYRRLACDAIAKAKGESQ